MVKQQDRNGAFARAGREMNDGTGSTGSHEAGREHQAGAIRGRKGFTLIELVLVMSIIGILLTIAQPMFKTSVRKAKETVLKENLFAMRSAIDQYYTDNSTYPQALEDLVAKGYLRAVPKDPVAEANVSWVTIPPVNPEETGVFDVKSSSSQTSSTGTPYSEW